MPHSTEQTIPEDLYDRANLFFPKFDEETIEDLDTFIHHSKKDLISFAQENNFGVGLSSLNKQQIVRIIQEKLFDSLDLSIPTDIQAELDAIYQKRREKKSEQEQKKQAKKEKAIGIDKTEWKKLNSFALIEKIPRKAFTLNVGPQFQQSTYPTIFSVVRLLFEGCVSLLLQELNQKIKDEVCPKRKHPPEIDEPTLWAYFACFIHFSLFQRTRIENFWGKNRKTTKKNDTEPNKSSKTSKKSKKSRKNSDEQAENDSSLTLTPQSSEAASNSSTNSSIDSSISSSNISSNNSSNSKKTEGNEIKIDPDPWILKLFPNMDHYDVINRAIGRVSDKTFRKMEEIVAKNFQKHWICCQQIAIDEMLSPLRGFSKFIQYEKDKPHKWGHKYFLLCDAFGYCYNFMFYGREKGVEIQETGQTIQSSVSSSSCLSSKTLSNSFSPYNIVLSLLKPIQKNSNYELFVDNYYSSINLAEKLLSEGFDFTATMKRNIPNVAFWEWKEKEMEKSGGVEFPFVGFESTKNPVLNVFSFKDHEKVVRMISTVTKTEKMKKRCWDQVQRKHYDSMRLAVQVYYSWFKNAVDKFDQNFLNFFRPRCFRWNAQKSRMFTLFKIILINAIKMLQWFENPLEEVDEEEKYVYKPQHHYLAHLKDQMSSYCLQKAEENKKKQQELKNEVKKKKTALRVQKFRAKKRLASQTDAIQPEIPTISVNARDVIKSPPPQKKQKKFVFVMENPQNYSSYVQ